MADEASECLQRRAWEALSESISGLVNNVNSHNIAATVRELLSENIVRGRGLFCQSIMQAQITAPTFTYVYAALAATINAKLPSIGELLLKRLILDFKHGLKYGDKTRCISSSKFISHLVNGGVVHEVLALEMVTLLLENPTDDNTEVGVDFLQEVSQKLTAHTIFEQLRHALQAPLMDGKTRSMIEAMLRVQEEVYKDYYSLPNIQAEIGGPSTHMITLDDVTNGEEALNLFKLDPKYEVNEEKYKLAKRELDDGRASQIRASLEEHFEEEMAHVQCHYTPFLPEASLSRVVARIARMNRALAVSTRQQPLPSLWELLDRSTQRQSENNQAPNSVPVQGTDTEVEGVTEPGAASLGRPNCKEK